MKTIDAPPAPGANARAAAEMAVRASYGRLVAILAARSRNIAAAEDALADALAAALLRWPEDGVPDRPEAWLLVAARRRLGQAARHNRVHEAAAAEIRLLVDTMTETDPAAIPDERLKLMFVCAHPAIEPAAQAPLMLQSVLGLDAARIAASFLTSPAAMSQRLVRAKARIREAGLAFEVPGRDELAGRLDAVLSAVYAAYGTGWDGAFGDDPRRAGLAEEAIWLGRLIVGLAGPQPEALGLLALMLASEARRPARRDAAGRFVALADQHPALWDGLLIDEAEDLLRRAATFGRPGRFQIEACIQSVHLSRRLTGRTDWTALAGFYDLLVTLAPTVGNRVARAAAIAEADGPAAGLAVLDALAAAADAYQPYWATRAHLLARSGQPAEAAASFLRAAGMAEDPALRSYLLGRAATLAS
ncbi:RNA polymerase sigma factor [Prosthecodimorpha staleyi]|uniref:RNA polymerase subunit sigma-70 n=1 Tax=Prosthecodimorpha staleyi TaxID=2840188 RepID=A0A947GDH4_9HYPH|nr:DUF6596 domain-containing protein [Prosthecodimorpha staleyi]MBT9288275.1 RNA polymerase subunit sigma-70 [Prosthecodimorpha staleyi]